MDRQQWRALILTAVVLGGGIWFLHMVSGILLPFLVGLMLAYAINPVVEKLEKIGMPRAIASVLPVSAAVSLLVLVLVLGVPLLVDQLTSFAQRLPVYLMTLQHFVLPDRLSHALNLRLGTDTLLRSVGMIGTQGAEWTVQTLQNTVSGVAWLVNITLLVLMTPVVAFYMLVDWPGLTNSTLRQFPKRWRESMREMAGEIDVKLAGYLRGTLAVCLSMGVFYAVGLSLVGPIASLMTGRNVDGLELGWAIGFATGIMAFLPVIGSTTGFLLMMLVALMQYQLRIWEPYALVSGLFFLGQFVEGYIMNPLLVGNRVGLHPLWVIFALLAGGALAGITGMLLAIPVAVIFSVLLPRLMRQWRAAFD